MVSTAAIRTAPTRQPSSVPFPTHFLLPAPCNGSAGDERVRALVPEADLARFAKVKLSFILLLLANSSSFFVERNGSSKLLPRALSPLRAMFDNDLFINFDGSLTIAPAAFADVCTRVRCATSESPLMS
jgi:hypothetical protein